MSKNITMSLVKIARRTAIVLIPSLHQTDTHLKTMTNLIRYLSLIPFLLILFSRTVYSILPISFSNQLSSDGGIYEFKTHKNFALLVKRKGIQICYLTACQTQLSSLVVLRAELYSISTGPGFSVHLFAIFDQTAHVKVYKVTYENSALFFIEKATISTAPSNAVSLAIDHEHRFLVVGTVSGLTVVDILNPDLPVTGPTQTISNQHLNPVRGVAIQRYLICSCGTAAVSCAKLNLVPSLSLGTATTVGTTGCTNLQLFDDFLITTNSVNGVNGALNVFARSNFDLRGTLTTSGDSGTDFIRSQNTLLVAFYGSQKLRSVTLDNSGKPVVTQEQAVSVSPFTLSMDEQGVYVADLPSNATAPASVLKASFNSPEALNFFYQSSSWYNYGMAVNTLQPTADVELAFLYKGAKTLVMKPLVRDTYLLDQNTVDVPGNVITYTVRSQFQSYVLEKRTGASSWQRAITFTQTEILNNALQLRYLDPETILKTNLTQTMQLLAENQRGSSMTLDLTARYLYKADTNCPSNARCPSDSLGTTFTCIEGFEVDLIDGKGCVYVPVAGLGMTETIVVVCSVAAACLAVSAVVAFWIRLRNAETTKKSRKGGKRDRTSDSSRTNTSQKSTTSHYSSDIRSNMTVATQLNTTIPLALPGYLIIDAEKDIKMVKKLGKGSFSMVYEALPVSEELQKRALSKTVAVKVLKDNPTEDADFQMESFQQEVALMADLSRYDNFVKIVGFSLRPQVIVMPNYDLGDFLHLIHRASKRVHIPDPDWTTTNVLPLLIDLGTALAHLHSKELSHNDVKPANALLEYRPIGSGGSPPLTLSSSSFHSNTSYTPHNPNPNNASYNPNLNNTTNPPNPNVLTPPPPGYRLALVLADFSFTSVRGDTKRGVKEFKFSKADGLSRYYAAPELHRAIVGKSSSHRDIALLPIHSRDTYAFGVVIYETIVRKAPWPSNDKHVVTQMVLRGNRPSVQCVYEGGSRMEPWIPVMQVGERCWTESALDRPAMIQVVNELREYHLQRMRALNADVAE